MVKLTEGGKQHSPTYPKKGIDKKISQPIFIKYQDYNIINNT